MSSSSPLIKIIFIKKVQMFAASTTSLQNLISLGAVNNAFYEAFYDYKGLIDILLKSFVAKNRNSLASFTSPPPHLEPRNGESKTDLLPRLFTDLEFSTAKPSSRTCFIPSSPIFKKALLIKCLTDDRLFRLLPEVFFPTRSVVEDVGMRNRLAVPHENLLFSLPTRATPASSAPMVTTRPSINDDDETFTPMSIALKHGRSKVLAFFLSRAKEELGMYCRDVVRTFPDPFERQKLFSKKKNSGPLTSLYFELENTIPFHDNEFMNTHFMRALDFYLRKAQFSDVDDEKERMILPVFEFYADVKRMLEWMTFEGLLVKQTKKEKSQEYNDDADSTDDIFSSSTVLQHEDALDDNCEYMNIDNSCSLRGSDNDDDIEKFQIPYFYFPSLEFMVRQRELPEKRSSVSARSSFPIRSQIGQNASEREKEGSQRPQKTAISRSDLFSQAKDAWKKDVIGEENWELQKSSVDEDGKPKTFNSKSSQSDDERASVGFTLRALMRQMKDEAALIRIVEIVITVFNLPRELRESAMKTTILQMAVTHYRVATTKFLIEKMHCNYRASRRYQSLTMSMSDMLSNSSKDRTDGSDGKKAFEEVRAYLSSLC